MREKSSRSPLHGYWGCQCTYYIHPIAHCQIWKKRDFEHYEQVENQNCPPFSGEASVFDRISPLLRKILTVFSVQNVKTFGYKLVTKVSSLYFMPGDGKKARQKRGETSPKTACPLAFRADWPWGTLYVFGSSPVNDFHFAGLAFLLRARERRTAIFHTSQPLFHRIPTSFPSLPQGEPCFCGFSSERITVFFLLLYVGV